MKIEVYEESKNFVFQLSNLSYEEKNVLEDDFMMKEGDVLYKTFSKETANIEIISKNFQSNFERVVLQRSGKEKANWQSSLKIVCEKLKNKDVNWYVSGSCALALRGIEVQPKDLNLIFDLKDLEVVKELFKTETVLPIIHCDDWVLEEIGALYIESSVDVAFGLKDILNEPEPLDSSPYSMNNLEDIEWNGYTIKIPPVHTSLNINKRRKRLERVKLIEEYMKNN